MSRTYRFRLLGLLALTAVAHVGAPQSSDLLVQTVPVGLKPLGIFYVDPYPYSDHGTALVANSGDDSLSVLRFNIDLTGAPPVRYPWAVTASAVHGIPSPYAVTNCGGWMVTSPSANSVSFVDIVGGKVVQTVRVGVQPYTAVGCVVSNNGDSSLSVIDERSHAVTKTIPNVPGARGPRGIACYAFTISRSMCFVAGTEADVVTLVDMEALKVVGTVPAIRRPTSLDLNEYRLRVASAADNTISEIDIRTLQVTSITRNVPTPQDFQDAFGWYVAATGPGNSLFDIKNGKVITAVPGAAGLVVGYSYARPEYKIYPPSFLLVTSPDSNSVYFLQDRPAAPSEFSLVGAAHYGRVAPGALASVFASTKATQDFYASSLPLPKTLGGVTLRIGGSLDFDTSAGRWVYSPTGAVEAPLLYVGSKQINFQAPPGIATGTTLPAQLIRPDGSALVASSSFPASAPGLFFLLMNGQGQAAALNQDNTQNFTWNPARRGSVIQIFATGAGETTPALAAGEAAPTGGSPLVLTKVQPTVTIGGKNAKVQFSGMAPGFVGVWQINAEVPADVTPSIAVPLVVTAAGASSNTVTIAVQ